MPLPGARLEHGAVAALMGRGSARALRLAAAAVLAASAALAAALAPAVAQAAGPSAGGVSFASRPAVAAAAPASLASPVAISPLATAAATTVGVSARDFRFTLGRSSAKRGVLRFSLVNRGRAPHNLVIRARGGRDLARTRIITAGKRASVSVRLAPGRYTLVCDVSNHVQLGMRAAFRVTRPRR